MAEGFLNILYGDKYEAHSAGIESRALSKFGSKKHLVEIGK